MIDAVVRRLMPIIPRGVIWTVAKRYVAGDRLEDALMRIRALRDEGFGTIIDVLGEGVADAGGARAAVAEYERALVGLRGVDPDAPISVKPTHLGLLIDPGLCEELLDGLCAKAAADGRLVRFEMEDSPTIDGTLDVFEAVAARHANLGCVLQSRLFRTADDVERLAGSVKTLNVRMVKGIYLEPPEIAWTEDADITDSYVALTARLLDAGARVGLATHHDALAARCLELLAERGLAPESGRYEFQCLMGVRRPFAAKLRDAGHPVRIYVPYGRDWHAYSMRRLQHNPQIARHILKAMFTRG